MWQKAIIESRKYGIVRCCSTLPDRNDRLSNVLIRFGLKGDASALHVVKRIHAAKILAHLLWKDLAYHSEIMSFDKATELARMFVENHSESGAKFHVNADWSRYHQVRSFSWSGLTDATFDGGIIAITPTIASCVWVEDED
jgi:hypothetical protein